MEMPDRESKKKWDKENVLIITVKLFRKDDQEIIDFLEGKTRSELIRRALREYMERHPDKEKGGKR